MKKFHVWKDINYDRLKETSICVSIVRQVALDNMPLGNALSSQIFEKHMFDKVMTSGQ